MSTKNDFPVVVVVLNALEVLKRLLKKQSKAPRLNSYYLNQYTCWIDGLLKLVVLSRYLKAKKQEYNKHT